MFSGLNLSWLFAPTVTGNALPRKHSPQHMFLDGYIPRWVVTPLTVVVELLVAFCAPTVEAAKARTATATAVNFISAESCFGSESVV
jgi:hypothetical protein